jgi:protein-S-isoprenylcysteine O-methyltransferase Ste14
MNIIIEFILYFLFSAILHSFLAMDHAKNKAKKLLGKGYGYYRIIYTLISIPLFAPAFIVWITHSNSTPVVYMIPQNFYPVVILVRLAALGMFVYSILQIDLLEFTGLKSQKKNVLITGGAYGIVRHPLYTAGLLLLITKMEMSLLDITAVLLVAVYLIIGAFIEERRLLSIYGDEYRQYQNCIAMFIPAKWFVKKIKTLIQLDTGNT